MRRRTVPTILGKEEGPSIRKGSSGLLPYNTKVPVLPGDMMPGMWSSIPDGPVFNCRTPRFTPPSTSSLRGLSPLLFETSNLPPSSFASNLPTFRKPSGSMRASTTMLRTSVGPQEIFPSFKERLNSFNFGES